MKELRDYLKTAKKYLTLLVILVVVFNASVLFYFLRQPQQSQASATLFVNRVPEPRNAQYYTFEGYYAGLASKEYTDVVTELLESPDLNRLAREHSGVEKASVQIKKLGPQLISTVIRAPTEDEARKMLLSLAEVANQRSKELAKNENQGAEITLVNPDPLVGPYTLNLLLFMGAATLASLITAFLLVITREYLRS
jgi:capsular polysaccharide biosynthesis protein